MNWRNLLTWIFVILIMLASAFAFTPQNDIDLKKAYQIINGTNISAENISSDEVYIADDLYLNGVRFNSTNLTSITTTTIPKWPINETVLENQSGTLGVNKSWWDVLYAALTHGSTHDGNGITAVGNQLNVNDGTGIQITGDAVAFDCSEVEGANVACSGETITVPDIWVNESGDSMTGQLNITYSTVNQQLNLKNTNPFGLADISLFDSAGARISFVKIGPNIPTSTDGLGGGGSGGIASFSGNLYLAVNGTDRIVFGNFPDGNTTKTNYTIYFETDEGAIIHKFGLIQKPLPMETGSSFSRINNFTFAAGEVAFTDYTRDGAGNLILAKAQQVGLNNSGSPAMNSQFDAPKSWLTVPSAIEALILDGGGNALGKWLRKKTDYINYTNYLMNNLSLMPGGRWCDFDTTGRTVPCRNVGDLEVTREAYIHEGVTIREKFDVVALNGSDANIIGGPLHPVFSEIVEEGLGLGENTFILNENFELGTLGVFAGVWSAVSDTGQCPNINPGTFCAGESGVAANAIMDTSFNMNDLAAENLTFDINADLDGPGGNDGTLTVTMNNNTGSGNVQVYQAVSTDVLDSSISVAVPANMDNTSSVTVTFSYTGTSANSVYVDNVKVNATALMSTLTNVSRDRTNIKLLGGDGTCDIFARDIEGTKQLNITCDDINLIGNVTQSAVTIVSENATGDIEAENLISRNDVNGSDFWDDGVNLLTAINAKHTPGDCPSGQYVQNTTTSGVECGLVSTGTLNHAALANLTWSVAGHTFDTDLNLNTNSITNGVAGTFSGALASATLNTGQGANELYGMDQPVRTSDAVAFSGINNNNKNITDIQSINATCGYFGGIIIGPATC